MKPLCIELFCGSFGWSAGWLALGGRAVGFDIEHQSWHGPVPRGADLVIQDARTLHGRQFHEASVILCSPPCTRYSYMAMPWSRAKALGAWYREDPSRQVALNELFNLCWQIQAEASEAAGRKIPLVVENVRGAQPWVGKAASHFGSYYLWGDVPALMPFTAGRKLPGGPNNWRKDGRMPGRWTNPAEWPTKNDGGSWFNQARNTESGVGQNPDGRKVPGIELRAVGFNCAAAQRYREERGVKQEGSGGAWFDKALDERRREATKATNGAGPVYGGDFGWDGSQMRKGSSHSNARKAASAQIAKIPFALSLAVAQEHWPGKLPPEREPTVWDLVHGYCTGA